jgi:hypothetical protein
MLRLHLLFVLTFSISSNAQISVIDSLKLALKSAKSDSARSLIYFELVNSVNEKTEMLTFSNSLKQIAEQQLLKCKNTECEKYKKYLAYALNSLAYLHMTDGDFENAKIKFNECLIIFEEIKLSNEVISTLNDLASIYNYSGEY